MSKLCPNQCRVRAVPFFIIAFAIFTPSVYAGSFSLNEQSVSGLGVAYAGGAAKAGDASTIFFNPAGIALLGLGEFQIGGSLSRRVQSFRMKAHGPLAWNLD